MESSRGALVGCVERLFTHPSIVSFASQSMACRDSWDIIMLDRRVTVCTMKQNKSFNSKILSVILGGGLY